VNCETFTKIYYTNNELMLYFYNYVIYNEFGYMIIRNEDLCFVFGHLKHSELVVQPAIYVGGFFT